MANSHPFRDERGVALLPIAGLDDREPLHATNLDLRDAGAGALRRAPVQRSPSPVVDGGGEP